MVTHRDSVKRQAKQGFRYQVVVLYRVRVRVRTVYDMYTEYRLLLPILSPDNVKFHHLEHKSTEVVNINRLTPYQSLCREKSNAYVLYISTNLTQSIVSSRRRD